MKITERIVRNLIHLLDQHGLIHGAGETKYQFCIQQAVNRVIHDDLYGQYSDSPEKDCLDQSIRSFGVRLNDCSKDMSEKERAMALKRYAVAELGSNEIDVHSFFSSMRQRLELREDSNGEDIIDDYFHGPHDPDLDPAQRLKKLADTAADVLNELGTQGGKFLYLIDEPDKKKREEAANKLGDQIFAASMADFGQSCCVVKPKHKH
jgi:hypothetical protein